MKNSTATVGKSLRKAKKLFLARRFPDVIRELEPEVFRYRDDYAFYYLLGTSCLYTSDFGGAFTYLKRAYQLQPDSKHAMLGLAAVHVKRREDHDALGLWLEVLDADPANGKAKRGLRYLKMKRGDSESPDVARIRKFYPSPGFYIPPWAYAICLVAASIAVVYNSLPYLKQAIEDSLPARRADEQALEISLPDDTVLQEFSGEYRYILDDATIRRTMDTIQDLFDEYRDNAARREINRILNSNAASIVRERVALVQPHLKEPNFTTLKDNFSYQEVRSDPYLYEGCHVRWKGRITNVRILTDAITFDFLVGYEDGKVLEGTVPAVLSFAADLDPEYPIELLGKVELVDQRILLRVVSIHRLSPR